MNTALYLLAHMQYAQSAIRLEWIDLLIACGLVLVAGLVSLGLRLQLERRLALASLRTVVQLLLIGYILRYVFDINSPWLIALVVAIMLTAATQSAIARSERSFKGVFSLTFIALVISGLITSYAVTAVVIGANPWWTPQYLIPLLGMILGNSLNGVSLCLDILLESLRDRRAEVEMELSLGASRWEAARRPITDAVRRGMIPIINSMSVVGLVSLPGMMTGQILAGADPVQAVRYQILVMFMIAAATSLACIGMALLIYKRLFNDRHQLKAERIIKK